jgi:hypothetical protein
MLNNYIPESETNSIKVTDWGFWQVSNFAQYSNQRSGSLGGCFEEHGHPHKDGSNTSEHFLSSRGPRKRLAIEVVLGGFMPATVQVGSILMKKWPVTMQSLGLESEPCSGSWSLVKVPDGFVLDRRIHAAGWNFFFMAGEVKGMFFGALGAKKIQRALRRILEKVRKQNFNSLEVTAIVAKRFLGVRYTVVTAHSRHLQRSCYLDDTTVRRASQHS